MRKDLEPTPTETAMTARATAAPVANAVSFTLRLRCSVSVRLGVRSFRNINSTLPPLVLFIVTTNQVAFAMRRLRTGPSAHRIEDLAWSDLQLAYFVGTVMWTYLNTQFLLARPGVESEELEPWQEAGETWRRLKVRFPKDIATYSTEQTLYFDQKGLWKRHDYDVEISGGTPAAHYLSDFKEFFGIMFPTKHRIFPRQPDDRSMPEPLVVSIELDHFVPF